MSASPGDQQSACTRSGSGQDAGRATALVVAVTGPTGAIGRSVIRALEHDERVSRIVGMARRPFEPAFLGWRKTSYRRGDVLDREAVDELVAEADVVVHLAYAIVGSRRDSARVNLAGSRNVFAAAVAADRPCRLVFASSLAAYGYHARNPVPLTEDIPPRGSPEHYYSANKAACEALLTETTAGSGMQVYVLRPCVVAGPDAVLLVRNLQLRQVAELVPGPARQLLARIPALRPVIPDPGVPVQLVHHNDVAAAVRAAVVAAGPPGPYNLAAEGVVTLSDLARAVGGYGVPVPRALPTAVGRLLVALPWVPAELEWVHAVKYPMLMDTGRARRDLGWSPQYTAVEALAAMSEAARAEAVYGSRGSARSENRV